MAGCLALHAIATNHKISSTDPDPLSANILPAALYAFLDLSRLFTVNVIHIALNNANNLLAILKVKILLSLRQYSCNNIP